MYLHVLRLVGCCQRKSNDDAFTAVGEEDAVLFSHINFVWVYRMSQEECSRLREGVPYVEVYRYNPKHLCPKLNGYGDNGQRSLKI